MAQRVTRAADLSPLPENSAEVLAEGDLGMLVLGWLCGVGEHALADQGWVIFPDESVCMGVYVHKGCDLLRCSSV